MEEAHLSITTPQLPDVQDFDIFTFWKGDADASLLAMPLFLTVDIFEMNIHKVYGSKTNNDPNTKIAIRQEMVHATYHRRAFHYFEKNKVNFRLTRLWSNFFIDAITRLGLFESYAGTFEYTVSNTVYNAQIQHFEDFAPHLGNPPAALLMWHLLEEAEHAHCFVNNHVLKKSKFTRFLLLISLMVFNLITAHAFVLENLHFIGPKRFFSALNYQRRRKIYRSVWRLVFGKAEDEQAFMYEVAREARRLRKKHGI